MQNLNNVADLVAVPSISKTLSSRSQSEILLTRYRLLVLYRFILATVGGYVLASLTAMVLAKVFSDYRASAVIGATIIAFCVHSAAFIWVFMVNKTLKASLGIIVPSIFLYVIYQVVGS
ncbi:hypothetical protein [Acinetobacter sp. ANC 4648]|uniref:hypothetical protein n=1 Tax=Acinetobacter sp. ANC 4648 TaxID=1977875 RepID=UPI000A33C80A|nr:hypothetical protein [Acinetobacter sp. ANC 4648]OTG82419.1 hypothetical protein B9T27_09315 [Acinetobacter sp. ANC 4648]